MSQNSTLMVQTDNAVKPGRRYISRRISAATHTEPKTPASKAADKNFSYLYIGKSFRGAMELHKGFTTAHFRFVFPEAMNLLERLQKANNLPDIILADGTLDATLLRAFAESLRIHEVLKSIPFLVDVTNIRDEESAVLAKFPGVTDLVNLSAGDTLMTKARFWQKLEKKEQVNKLGIQKGMNALQVSRYLSIRAFDIVFSAASILLLFPVMFLIGLLIRFSGNTNIFSLTTERGLGYRNFRYLRFRTDLAITRRTAPEFCAVNRFADLADQSKMQILSKNQGFGVVLGNVLQATSLDELPALFNVLVGDISFIAHR